MAEQKEGARVAPLPRPAGDQSSMGCQQLAVRLAHGWAHGMHAGLDLPQGGLGAHNGLLSSHPLTVHVHPPERITGVPALHWYEQPFPRGGEA